MDFLKLFKKNSINFSDKIALRFQDLVYSYKELDELSNYICLLLEKNNIKKGDIVGIMMPRNEKILISIIGILKYGCAFLPIDIDFPKERIEYILKNSRINSILTTELNFKYDRINIININNLYKLNEYKISTPFHSYVIYTSGSTGNPKGVLLKYDSLNNLLSSFVDIFKIKQNDNFLAITTISFDISILELLLPLCVGGTVVIAPSRCQIDPYYLAKIIEKYDITFMQATPVTWKMLIDSNWSNPNHLKIICGGEALSKQLAKNLMRISNNVWNVYGPTETTIWSSCCKLNESNDIHIGAPIKNTIFKVINNGQFAQEGELYIGGIGLAEGYLYNKELTDEKFEIIDGIRYYKTGDIVKLIDDKYYYICRCDHQVKISGHRIELGEVENVVSSYNKVFNTVVIYDQELKNLICFIIEKKTFSDTEIIDFISKKLPSYMIPNRFVRVNEFPLTNNKKIDRKKLIEDYSSNINSYNQKNSLSSYDIVKLMVELEEKFEKRKAIQKIKFENHEIWIMQELMYKHKIFYPESSNFYEQIVLYVPKINNSILNKILDDLKNNLDIFKIGIKRIKGKYVFINEKDNLIKVDVNDNKIILDYHNCIIDGESINILISIIIDKLNNKKVNYGLYNNFINDIELLNSKLNITEEYFDLKKLFSRDFKGKEYRRNFKISRKQIDLFAQKNGIKISEVIQYVFCKNLMNYTKENIKFGIINSNRNFTNSLSIGNFINIVHQEYEHEDLKDIDKFIKKCILNKKHYFFKYNENNAYEFLLIINNMNELNNMLQKNGVYIDMGDYVYENNNSPINFKFNIDSEKVDIYISSKNILSSKKIIKFINDFEENMKNI